MAASARSPEDRLIQTAFTLIERDGWAGLSMLALAKAAKIKVAELYRLAPDKGALLSLILAALDRDIVERLTEQDTRAPLRDRVFDAVLNAFEAMGPRKPVMRVLFHDLRRDPGAWAAAWKGLKQTSAWVAESAGVDTRGMMGAVRLRGLSVLLADTTAVWLDDGDDLGRTMAHVDGRLRRLEKAFSIFRRARKETAAPGHETAHTEDNPA
jgi:AcrR family transcriptional regulator